MKITTETALQWCAEIVPEWEFQDEREWGKGYCCYIRDYRGHVDIWNDRNAAARLVEAFVDGHGDGCDRAEKFTECLHAFLFPLDNEYALITATARQRTLAVLSAYKGEMVEVEDDNR